MNEQEYKQQKKDLIELHDLKAENKRLKERLQKTTKYLEVRTKPQRPYSVPRLVDKIIEENKKALKEEGTDGK